MCFEWVVPWLMLLEMVAIAVGSALIRVLGVRRLPPHERLQAMIWGFGPVRDEWMRELRFRWWLFTFVGMAVFVLTGLLLPKALQDLCHQSLTSGG